MGEFFYGNRCMCVSGCHGVPGICSLTQRYGMGIETAQGVASLRPWAADPHVRDEYGETIRMG